MGRRYVLNTRNFLSSSTSPVVCLSDFVFRLSSFRLLRRTFQWLLFQEAISQVSSRVGLTLPGKFDDLNQRTGVKVEWWMLLQNCCRPPLQSPTIPA